MAQDGATEDREMGDLGLSQRMRARSDATGATSWDIVSEIVHNSKIERRLLQQ